MLPLRAQRSDLRVFVLDCDHGLGVLTRGEPEQPLSYGAGEIARMTIDDLAHDRASLLNLKNPAYFDDFIATTSSA